MNFVALKFDIYFLSLMKLITNCSQTKFVAVTVVLSVFLCDFSLDQFFWRIWLFVLKKGITSSAQRALSALRAFQLTGLQVCDSQNLFWRLILMVRSRFLEIDPPTATPPPPTFATPSTPVHPPPPPLRLLTPLQLSSS